MKKEYLVIVCTEDGPSVNFLSAVVLKKNLEDKYWGDIDWIKSDDERPIDLMCSAGQGIIMKGSMIIPKEKAVAWEYDIG